MSDDRLQGNLMRDPSARKLGLPGKLERLLVSGVQFVRTVSGYRLG